ncbi:hypothetical protein CCAND95_100039 [Capnocytophaga canis]|nr:hypothetical protein CCAND95_100039 [Capnocytophaga canis]
MSHKKRVMFEKGSRQEQIMKKNTLKTFVKRIKRFTFARSNF